MNWGIHGLIIGNTNLAVFLINGVIFNDSCKNSDYRNYLFYFSQTDISCLNHSMIPVPIIRCNSCFTLNIILENNKHVCALFYNDSNDKIIKLFTDIQFVE